MNIRRRIAEARLEALGHLRDAVSRGSSSETLEIADILEALERLEQELSRFEDQVEKQARRLQLHRAAVGEGKVETTELIYGMKVGDKAFSPRETGKLQRRSFLSKLESKGIRLLPKKGALYTTPDDGIAAIGFATERRKGRFFLGVPIKNYRAVVLLCQRDNKETLEFVLPGDLIDSLRQELENRGQFKFNIIVDDNKYYLGVRGGKRINLTDYQSHYDHLIGGSR